MDREAVDGEAVDMYDMVLRNEIWFEKVPNFMQRV